MRFPHPVGSAAIFAILAGLSARPGVVRAQTRDSAPAFHAPTLVGKVHDAGGMGISLVRVSAKTSGHTGLSDSTGHFVIRGLDTGNVAFTVHRIGYEPAEFTVSLDSGETFTLDLTLNQTALELDKVEVDAESRVREALSMFYRHKSASVGGVFFVRADIEKKRPTSLSEMLQTVPGITLQRSRFFGADGVRMARNAVGHDCPVMFFLDGARAPWLNVDDIPPMDVEAMEIYHGAATLPVEYNIDRGTPACGVIAIWTRVPGH